MGFTSHNWEKPRSIVGIGAQKAGTSAFFSILEQHGSVTSRYSECAHKMSDKKIGGSKELSYFIPHTRGGAACNSEFEEPNDKHNAYELYMKNCYCGHEAE